MNGTSANIYSIYIFYICICMYSFHNIDVGVPFLPCLQCSFLDFGLLLFSDLGIWCITCIIRYILFHMNILKSIVYNYLRRFSSEIHSADPRRSMALASQLLGQPRLTKRPKSKHLLRWWYRASSASRQAPHRGSLAAATPPYLPPWNVPSLWDIHIDDGLSENCQWSRKPGALDQMSSINSPDQFFKRLSIHP